MKHSLGVRAAVALISAGVAIVTGAGAVSANSVGIGGGPGRYCIEFTIKGEPSEVCSVEQPESLPIPPPR